MSLTRRNHGSGHSYEMDGRWVPGVTTLLGSGFPKPALINWAGNTTAKYAVDHWDEIAELPVSGRLDLLMRARNIDRDDAARRGTEVHTLAQRLLADESVVVPEELVGHVDSYLQFLADWDVRPLLVETTVGRREQIRYAGTLDLVAEFADDRLWLVDLKTTRSGVFTENALQLAAYRFAQFYIDAAGDEQPMPQVDQCGVVWLRAEGYDLYPVEAGEAEFRLFQMVARIAALADRKMGERMSEPDRIGEPLSSPTKEVTT